MPPLVIPSVSNQRAEEAVSSRRAGKICGIALKFLVIFGQRQHRFHRLRRFLVQLRDRA